MAMQQPTSKPMWQTSVSSVEMWTQNLEREAKSVFNVTAKEYLATLQQYLERVDIVVAFNQQHDPNKDISIDTSIGIVWIVVVPLVYFLSVALLLACILSYFWFIDSAKEGCERSRISLGISARREGSTRTAAGSRRGHIIRPSLENGIQSIASASSTLSSISFLGLYNNAKTNATLQPQCLLGLYNGSDQKAIESGAAVGLVERSSASRSSFHGPSVASFQRVLASCNTSMNPDSAENKSRESLRMSSEYHKLVWTSGGDIPPDKLYGTDDEKMEIGMVQSQSPKVRKQMTSSKGVHTSSRKTPNLTNIVSTEIAELSQYSLNTDMWSDGGPGISDLTAFPFMEGLNRNTPKPMIDVAVSHTFDVLRTRDADRWSGSVLGLSDFTEFPFMEDTVHVYVNPLFSAEHNKSSDDLGGSLLSEPEVKNKEPKALNIEPEGTWQTHRHASDGYGPRRVREFRLRNMTPIVYDDSSSLSDNMAVEEPLGGENGRPSDSSSGDLWPSQSESSSDNPCLSLSSSIARFHDRRVDQAEQITWFRVREPRQGPKKRLEYPEHEDRPPNGSMPNTEESWEHGEQTRPDIREKESSSSGVHTAGSRLGLRPTRIPVLKSTERLRPVQPACERGLEFRNDFPALKQTDRQNLHILKTSATHNTGKGWEMNHDAIARIAKWITEYHHQDSDAELSTHERDPSQHLIRPQTELEQTKRNHSFDNPIWDSPR